jgi:hypothetical protein
MSSVLSDTKRTAPATLYQRIERKDNGRKIRKDALPEHWDFEDGGCELAPQCLRCPLAVCRYDQPGGALRLRTSGRNETLRRFRAEGLSVDALAERYRLSRRTVFRALAERV